MPGETTSSLSTHHSPNAMMNPLQFVVVKCQNMDDNDSFEELDSFIIGD